MTTLALVLLAVSGEMALAAPMIETEETRAAPSSPVVFRGAVLFQIGAPIGRLSASERATEIGRRLDQIARQPASVLEDIRTVEREDRTDVVAGDRLIVSVGDTDSEPTGRTRRQLAADRAHAIHDALATDFHDRSTRSLVLGAVYTLCATLAMVAFFWILSLAFPRLYLALARLSEKRLGHDAKLLFMGGLSELPAGLARLLRLFLSLVGLYLYLNLTLSFFPWSRGISEQLFGYFRTAALWLFNGILHYLPNLVYIAIIVVLMRYVVKFAEVLFEAVDRGRLKLDGFYPEWAMPTFKIVRVLLLAFEIVLVFPYLPGSSSPAFKGVSVFLGILLSLGSASAIGNLVSGVVLTYMRPFQPGDRVKVADTVGDIVAKNLLVVRVRTIKNVEVTIPNAIVLSNHIINYSTCAQDNGLILHATVTIGYDAPWRKVHELLLAAARKTEGLLQTPAPFILQTALDDFYVHYEINAYTNQPNRMAQIYSDLRAVIQDTFNEAGVEICSPHFVAARDGNRVAIPDQYLPRNYETPSFHILPTRDKGTK